MVSSTVSALVTWTSTVLESSTTLSTRLRLTSR
jgi:hypothetical protein